MFFLVNVRFVKDVIFIYFLGGGGVCRGIKLTLSSHSLWKYCVYLITNRFVIKVASTR